MQQMTFTPLGRRVVVRPEKQQEKTAGGIIIPDAVKQRTAEAIVVEAGVECVKVKKGDKILYEAGSEIPIEVMGEVLNVLIEGNGLDNGNIILILP